MSYYFNNIEDTPDITLHPNQLVVITHSSTHNDAATPNTYRKAMNVHIHLKDYLKIREKVMQKKWAAAKLQNIAVTIAEMTVN